jgi:hypothetical protein
MLLDVDAHFGQNADGLFIARHQVIPQDFLDDLADERNAKTSTRALTLHRVASVPTAVIELWMRQGRDPMNATPHEIVSWLERDDLHAFITTPGRV